MKSNKENNLSDSKNISKRGGLFNEFFWICSGANREVLRKCPTDHSKYFGIGGTIFFTAAMAWLSGGYAISMVFHDTTIGVLVGLFWALLIFNLDRFMVNTMYSDGTAKITKEEWMSGIPRLVLAVFIGVVISTPIELRIFEDKINEQLIEENKAIAISKFGGDKEEKMANIKKIDLENAKLDSVNAILNEKIDEAWNTYNNERLGLGGSGKAGYGPHALRAEDNYNDVHDKYSPRIHKNDSLITYNTHIRDSLQGIIYVIDKKINDFVSSENTIENAGFTDRLTAFNKVTSQSVILIIARIMVMLLFIAIEIIPTLFKMMMTSGVYDEMLKEQMEKAKAESIRNISKVNDEINTQIQISVEKNKNKLEAEIAANKELLEKIAVTQAELLKTAVEEWRNQELEKIHQDPSAYIKSNTIQPQS